MTRYCYIFLVLLGCDSATTASVECRENRECALPLSCIEGRCVEACRRHADCAQGELCYQSVCYPPVDTCRNDIECAPFGQVCDEAQRLCVPVDAMACHPELNPCPRGQACRDGQCRLITADAGLPDARPRPDAATRDAEVDARGPDASSPPRDAGRPERDAMARDANIEADASSGMGLSGEVCRCGSDCVSGFCVENKLFNTRTCTDLCRNDGECPNLDVCLAVQVSGPTRECPGRPGGPEPGEVLSVCIPNDTGFPCDFEAAQNPCLSGVCLQPPQPADWIHVQDQCAMFCEDDRKCPNGYRCGAVGGVQRRVCQPAVEVFSCPDGTINACGGVCPPAAGREEVDLALCINLQADQAGYCSCTCASARDCPVGFACSRLDGVDTGDRQRPSICLPMAGYRCPGELERPQEPQCPSLFCALDDVRPTASVCTAPCVREADCPANHACRGIDGVPGLYCLAFE